MDHVAGPAMARSIRAGTPGTSGRAQGEGDLYRGQRADDRCAHPGFIWRDEPDRCEGPPVGHDPDSRTEPAAGADHDRPREFLEGELSEDQARSSSAATLCKPSSGADLHWHPAIAGLRHGSMRAAHFSASLASCSEPWARLVTVISSVKANNWPTFKRN